MEEKAPKNPLEVPEILERISRNCSVKDLKEFRQVSRFWEKCSRKAFVSSSKVIINDFGYSEPTNLPKYLKFAKSMNGIPHENFLLYRLHFTRYLMWGLHTSFVKHLELSFCKFESVDVFRTVIFRSLQNLKHLEINCCKFVPNPQGRRVAVEPVQWQEPAFGVHRSLKTLKVGETLGISKMELLSHFSSLEELDLTLIFEEGRATEICSWFESIEKIRGGDPNALKLKTLRFNTWGEPYNMNPLLRVLEDPQLPLEELELKLDSGDAVKPLRDIIWTHVDTLKRLHLNTRVNPANIFRGPGNEDLKIEELSLLSPVIFSLEFLKHMPALKSIKFAPSTYRIYGHEVGDICLPECTKVKFGDIWWDFSSLADFESFIRCFPNIQDLTVHHVDDERFLRICEHCPHLVKLTLKNVRIDEGVLTGLDDRDRAAINEHWANGDAAEPWKPTSARRPNISLLKGLRKLSMDNTRIKLDYAEMTYGFLRLPNLEELHLQVLKVHPEVEETLCRRVPICKIRADRSW